MENYHTGHWYYSVLFLTIWWSASNLGAVIDSLLSLSAQVVTACYSGKY